MDLHIPVFKGPLKELVCCLKWCFTRIVRKLVLQGALSVQVVM